MKLDEVDDLMSEHGLRWMSMCCMVGARKLELAYSLMLSNECMNGSRMLTVFRLEVEVQLTRE